MAEKKNQMFAAVLKRIDIPNIDWEEIAAECAYKDGKNAKTMFSRFRKQLMDNVAETTGPEGGIQKTSSPRGKKPGGNKSPKKVVTDADGDDEEVPATPSRRGRKTKSEHEVKEDPDATKDEEDSKDSTEAVEGNSEAEVAV